ncbi:MAG: hypothetical protein C4521_10985 [Actinobacteria bacterium]|nr:MAG: hypothetical protein C4521_10985 [Actinomycetota bacterium]
MASRDNPQFAGIEIRLDELKRSGPLFYAWVATLLILMGLGTFAYSLQYRHGFAATGLSDAFPWGLYIQNFMYFVGLSAGGLVTYASVQLFGAKKLEPIARVAVVQAAVCNLLAALFIMPDIGRPLLSFQFVTSPNPLSILFWDATILNVYLVLCLVDLWVMITGFGGHKLELKMTLVSFPAAVGVHTITAWILAFAKTRELWHTSLMAPLFLSSAMSSGIALLILIGLALRRLAGMRFKDEMFHIMAKVLATVVFVDLFFLFVEIMTTFWPASTTPGHAMRLGLLLTGEYAKFFIPQLTVFGLLPFLLLMHPKTRRTNWIMATSCGLIVTGVFIKRFMLLAMGFGVSPLGPFDNRYVPTLVEVAVTVALWALGLLIFTLAVKLLPLQGAQEEHDEEHQHSVEQAPEPDGKHPLGEPSRSLWVESQL